MQQAAKNFVSSGKRVLKKFRADQMGNIAMLSAISMVPIFLIAGAAIDTVRITREQASFNAAVDSAVLAIAADDRSSLMGLNASQQAARIAELEEYAKKYLQENYTPETFNTASLDLSLTITGQAIDINASHEFPTTITKIFGVDEVDLAAHSQVQKAMRPIEMVLVMDTTGSMATDDKITGAKNAAKALLDTIYAGPLASAPESEFIRVGLVPFAAGVRLDKTGPDFNLGWIDTTGVNPISKLHFNNIAWNNYMAWSQMKTSSTTQLQWNGCVEARKRTTGAAGTDYNVNDSAPSLTNPDTLFPAYFAPDTPSYGNSSAYGSYRNQNWSGTYIPESGTPSEVAGMTTAQRNDTTNAGQLNRQENVLKYVNRVITPETSSATVGPWQGCAKTPVVPMTYKRSDVVAGINAMTAAGPTLIAEGLAWGMRVMSPTAPFTQVQGTASISASTISNYNDVRWQKTIVLMTDGDNDLSAGLDSLNGTTYSSYGRGKEPTGAGMNRFGTTSDSSIMTNLDNAMLEVCDKIKAQNVELYVTSFGNGVSTSTRNRLRACATDADNYQHATSSADLQAFFNHIGEETLNKSIYVSK